MINYGPDKRLQLNDIWQGWSGMARRDPDGHSTVVYCNHKPMMSAISHLDDHLSGNVREARAAGSPEIVSERKSHRRCLLNLHASRDATVADISSVGDVAYRRDVRSRCRATTRACANGSCEPARYAGAEQVVTLDVAAKGNDRLT